MRWRRSKRRRTMLLKKEQVEEQRRQVVKTIVLLVVSANLISIVQPKILQLPNLTPAELLDGAWVIVIKGMSLNGAVHRCTLLCSN